MLTMSGQVTPLDCSNGMTRFQRKFPSRKAMFRPTMRIVGSYPVFKVRSLSLPHRNRSALDPSCSGIVVSRTILARSR